MQKLYSTETCCFSVRTGDFHHEFESITVTPQAAHSDVWRAHLHTGHSSGIVGGGVAKGDVGDELEPELPGVQQPHQGFVVLVGFHRLLHHDPGVEDFLQHAGQDSFPHRRLDGDNKQKTERVWQSVYGDITPAEQHGDMLLFLTHVWLLLILVLARLTVLSP